MGKKVAGIHPMPSKAQERATQETQSPSNLIMKQPTNQEDRNEDKKKPEKENPSHGIDPETDEPEMEVANP